MIWILSILNLILLILLIVLYRQIQKLKLKENENLQRGREIAELELTALRSQMNPHFIFNALGSIQYFIQTQDTDKADIYLSDFAMLIRHILESSKLKFISLSEELNLLRLYIRLEKIRFEKLFEYEIKVDKEIDLAKPIPPMIIQPFVENSINHGLYNLKTRKGKLLIYFKYIDQNTVLCHVKDNGIGRIEALKHKKKEHKSRGLEIVKKRINTINMQNEINMNIDVIDLKDNYKVIGTDVKIQIDYIRLKAK